MSAIDPADVSLRIGHELGTLLVLKVARFCPSCCMQMMTWLDTGSAAACFCCVTNKSASALRRPPKRIEPRTTEHT